MHRIKSNWTIALFRIFAAFFAGISLWMYSALPSNSASNQFFDQGTTYYQRGDYLSASAAFSWALRESPNDTKAHYYLGNTLVKLGRMSEAQLHYMSAIRSGTDPTIKKYCEAALSEIARAGAQNNAQPGAPAMMPQYFPYPQSQPAATPPMASNFGYPASPSGTVGAIRNDQKQRASQMIDQQADRTSAGILNMGSGEAASTLREGQWKATDVQSSTARLTRSMQSATYNSLPIYSPADIQRATDQGNAASAQAMAEANERSANAMQFAKAKAWETQAAAKNLQDQLNAPTTSSGAKLKAEGTNLFVRNFDTPMMDPGAPLVAQPGKLKVVKPLEAVPQQWEDAAGARAKGAAGGNGADGRSSVYGKVMP